MQSRYTVRQFLPEEWASLKAIRLEALRAESDKFSASYKEESQVMDTKWAKRVQRGDQAYFALYHDDTIIGMTGAMIDNHKTAKLMASYIREGHRGQGLSAMLYEARLDWARSKGVERVLVSHRKSNLPSMHANQKFGFVKIYEEDAIWPDGGREPRIVYQLKL